MLQPLNHCRCRLWPAPGGSTLRRRGGCPKAQGETSPDPRGVPALGFSKRRASLAWRMGQSAWLSPAWGEPRTAVLGQHMERCPPPWRCQPQAARAQLHPRSRMGHVLSLSSSLTKLYQPCTWLYPFWTQLRSLCPSCCSPGLLSAGENTAKLCLYGGFKCAFFYFGLSGYVSHLRCSLLPEL